MAIRLIIFDLDGTLVDSIGDITDAVNYAFRPCGIGDLEPGEVAGMIGEGARELVRKICESRNVVFDKALILARYKERYAAHPTDRTVLYPFVIETLEKLTSCRKAIVSNKSEGLSRQILDRFGLLRFFDTIVCADTIPERKPSPAPVYYVLSALHAGPHEAVIVGDSEIDVMTGKASSIRSIAVTYGYGSPGFQKDADFVIDSFAPLAELITKIE